VTVTEYFQLLKSLFFQSKDVYSRGCCHWTACIISISNTCVSSCRPLLAISSQLKPIGAHNDNVLFWRNYTSGRHNCLLDQDNLKFAPFLNTTALYSHHILCRQGSRHYHTHTLQIPLAKACVLSFCIVKRFSGCAVHCHNAAHAGHLNKLPIDAVKILKPSHFSIACAITSCRRC